MSVKLAKIVLYHYDEKYVLISITLKSPNFVVYHINGLEESIP